jgi:general nucleoside transport system permease protein
METMPKWADVILVPLISLLIAFFISGLVIWGIGESPTEALRVMVSGALGSTYGWGFVLYYTTNFLFTGLAVSVAFHASLFNIGGEGQATMAGLGVALACLLVPWPHWSMALLASMIMAITFGAAWAALPAWLQAKRGSHIVITTIMFNYLSYRLLNYLLVNVLRPEGSMDPASARFSEVTNLPNLGTILGMIGIPFSEKTPANLTFIIALICAGLVWVLLWHTRLGYQIRAFGKSEKAAVYAGINPVRITMYAMLISGALAGLMAVNSVQGVSHRLLLNSVENAGFIGIAVALMGRNHPVGVIIAALLFGFLYEGGSQLALWTKIPKDLITVIQALVILFTGALPYLVRRPLERMFQMRKRGVR